MKNRTSPAPAHSGQSGSGGRFGGRQFVKVTGDALVVDPDDTDFTRSRDREALLAAFALAEETRDFLVIVGLQEEFDERRLRQGA